MRSTPHTPLRSMVAAAALLGAPALAGAIPATPLMTLYRFDAALDVPFYRVEDFARRGSAAPPAGSLAQGTSVIPCLVIREGRPLTDASGTPFVGFEVVVDSRTATPESTARFEAVLAEREQRAVKNHHCPEGVRYVIDVRNLYAMRKAPFFDPPAAAGAPVRPASELDGIVRAFHESTQCRDAQRRLIGRRAALSSAWTAFARASAGKWPKERIDRARHLDYTMRTALYEGHLDRGCSAYGACERNVVALSIRNRALESCRRGQGCRHPGDFEGVASTVSQYNIWDEYLTQVSGLTSCFLRSDLAGREFQGRLQRMYAQNLPDVERLLLGDANGLAAVFPGTPAERASELRHYYHPPAMGKCFPGHPRVEYMSGAVARSGTDFALVANTRIEVGPERDGGYPFRSVSVEDAGDRDVVRVEDDHPGFLVDPRKVTLRKAAGCRPYGTPAGCRFDDVGRHRRTPGWLDAGRPLELSCRVVSRAESCRGGPETETASVGGICDVEMQPVAGVP